MGGCRRACHTRDQTLPHPTTRTSRTPKTGIKSANRHIPLHVRGALAVLRRFAELERGDLQRKALTAWVDHLAHMIAHPYALQPHEKAAA